MEDIRKVAATDFYLLLLGRTNDPTFLEASKWNVPAVGVVVPLEGDLLDFAWALGCTELLLLCLDIY